LAGAGGALVFDTCWTKTEKFTEIDGLVLVQCREHLLDALLEIRLLPDGLLGGRRGSRLGLGGKAWA
jgi:hypothetical protein